MNGKSILRRALQAVAILGLATLAGLARPAASRAVLAETAIFASPVQGGCYLVRPDACKIHLEPFTIQIASGQKLTSFQLVAIRMSDGRQTMIYDFRPDLSNPVPFTGTAFTPSLVAKDFAAACATNYEISLQGRDSGDSSTFSLGLTNTIVCPSATYRALLPVILR